MSRPQPTASTTSSTGDHAPARLDPMTVVSGVTLIASALLVGAFFLVVRGEPRIDLAAGSGLLLLAVAVATLRRVPFAALLGVPLTGFLVLFPALRRYYAFSFERPDETLGLVFSVAALAVAGVVATSGVAATVARIGGVRALAGRGAAVGAVVVGLLAGAVVGVVVASDAQPDQSDGLTAAEVENLPGIVMDDYRFTPDRLEGVVGEELVIRLTNDDTETYRFTIDELGVDTIVPSGRTAVVRLTPEAPGQLEFYSSEEGGEHRDLGMVGQIDVSS